MAIKDNSEQLETFVNSLVRDLSFNKNLPPDFLVWIVDFFKTKYAKDLDVPSVCFVDDSEFQIDWSFGQFEIYLDIDFHTKHSEFQVDDTETRSVHEVLEFDLNTEEGCQHLNERIRDYSKAV